MSMDKCVVCDSFVVVDDDDDVYILQTPAETIEENPKGHSFCYKHRYIKKTEIAVQLLKMDKKDINNIKYENYQYIFDDY